MRVLRSSSTTIDLLGLVLGLAIGGCVSVESDSRHTSSSDGADPDAGDGDARPGDLLEDLAGDVAPPDTAQDGGEVGAEDAQGEAVDGTTDARPDDTRGDGSGTDGAADGVIEQGPDHTVFPPACMTCHGDLARLDPAPPKAVSGDTTTDKRAVGAHQAHRRTDPARETIPHAPILCQACHPVPLDITQAPHLNGVRDVVWTGLAVGQEPTGRACATDADCLGVVGFPTCDGILGTCVSNERWDPASAKTTCSGVYCHGATLPDGSNKTPSWTTVDGTQAACGTCHGTPPGCGHPQYTNCAPCHSKTIQSCPDDTPAHCVFWPDRGPDETYRNHINGKVDTVLGAGGTCTACHGAPPKTGVHLIHAGGADPPTVYGSLEPRPNATAYGFNCGYCHSLDNSRHMNCKVDVELYNAKAPAAPTNPLAPGDRRAIKGENKDATYTPGPNSFPGEVAPYTDGTCSNVYCHSEQREVSSDAPFPDRDAFYPNPLNATDPGATYLLKFALNTYDQFMNAKANTCCAGTVDSYPDFTIEFLRAYRTPKWQGESHAKADRCAHCHGYPPKQTKTDSNKMAGDSHGYFEGGMEIGHFIDMGGDHNLFGPACTESGPVQCRRCHKQTVTNYLDNADWSFGVAGTQIANAMDVDYGFHVNGKKEVEFDKGPASPRLNYVCPFDLGPVTELSELATWDYGTRTCTNISCHLRQVEVSWGQPMDYFDLGDTCNVCHQK